jgi:hypothetical protein
VFVEQVHQHDDGLNWINQSLGICRIIPSGISTDPDQFRHVGGLVQRTQRLRTVIPVNFKNKRQKNFEGGNTKWII